MFLDKFPASGFMTICAVGAMLILVARWMDRHNEANRWFSLFVRMCLIIH